MGVDVISVGGLSAIFFSEEYLTAILVLNELGQIILGTIILEVLGFFQGISREIGETLYREGTSQTFKMLRWTLTMILKIFMEAFYEVVFCEVIIVTENMETKNVGFFLYWWGDRFSRLTHVGFYIILVIKFWLGLIVFAPPKLRTLHINDLSPKSLSELQTFQKVGLPEVTSHIKS